MQDAAVLGQLHPVVLGLDDSIGDLIISTPGGDEVALGLDHVVLAVHAEGDEQETGLVVVVSCRVDDRDLPLVAVEQPRRRLATIVPAVPAPITSNRFMNGEPPCPRMSFIA